VKRQFDLTAWSASQDIDHHARRAPRVLLGTQRWQRESNGDVGLHGTTQKDCRRPSSVDQEVVAQGRERAAQGVEVDLATHAPSPPVQAGKPVFE